MQRVITLGLALLYRYYPPTWYQRHSLKQRYVRTKRPSKKIIQIGTTWQRYNIGKIYVSSTLPSTRTSFNIVQINEVMKALCHKNSFVFIDHQSITSNDLWVDGVLPTNSGKAILARDVVEKVNGFLGQNSNFQRSLIW